MSCTKKKIFKDDIGIQFKVYSKVNLSDASLIQFAIKKPSGTIVRWTASISPINNYYALYTTEEDDLDEEGNYLLSLELTLSDGSFFKGTTDEFEVYEQFTDIE